MMIRSVVGIANMDASFRSSYDSPAKNGSPMQGHTMKDYEEQLSSLRKENFNLKLNVYFLEERLYSSPHLPASRDNLLKENIELKVSLENMRFELNEKQELLRTAARALDLMEATATRKEEEFLSQIASMQDEAQHDRCNNLSRLGNALHNDDTGMQVDDSVALYTAAFNLKPLEANPKENETCDCAQLKSSLKLEKENVIILRDTIASRERQIAEQKEHIQSLQDKVLCNDVEVNKPADRGIESVDSNDISHQLERLQKENLNACQMIQGCLIRIKQMDRENKKMKNVLNQKDSVISKLQMEENADDKLSQKYKVVFNAQNERIHQLEDELKHIKSVSKDNDNSRISTHSDDNNFNQLNNHLKQKINILRESILIKPQNNVNENGNQHVQDSDDISQSNIQELLVRRLQEMAYFLDSLLSSRCIVNEDKRRKVKNLLDQTLELPYGLTLDPDQSYLLEETFNRLSQSLKLEDLTRLFGHHNVSSADDTRMSCNLNNCTNITVDNEIQHSECEINPITNGVETISEAINEDDETANVSSRCSSKKNKSKSFNDVKPPVNISPRRNVAITDLSESECWSEPDRNVSLARMGGRLEGAAVKDGISSDEDVHNRPNRKRETRSSLQSSFVRRSYNAEDDEPETSDTVENEDLCVKMRNVSVQCENDEQLKINEDDNGNANDAESIEGSHNHAGSSSAEGDASDLENHRTSGYETPSSVGGQTSAPEPSSLTDADPVTVTRLMAENAALRNELEQTRGALKAATSQLKCIRYPQKVQRAVCQEIHRTHSLLRHVRDNLELGKDIKIKRP